MDNYYPLNGVKWIRLIAHVENVVEGIMPTLLKFQWVWASLVLLC